MPHKHKPQWGTIVPPLSHVDQGHQIPRSAPARHQAAYPSTAPDTAPISSRTRSSTRVAKSRVAPARVAPGQDQANAAASTPLPPSTSVKEAKAPASTPASAPSQSAPPNGPSDPQVAVPYPNSVRTFIPGVTVVPGPGNASTRRQTSRPSRSPNPTGSAPEQGHMDRNSSLAQPPEELIQAQIQAILNQGRSQRSSRSRRSGGQGYTLPLHIPDHVLRRWSSGHPDCAWEWIRSANDIARCEAQAQAAVQVPPESCQCLTCVRINAAVYERHRRELRERGYIGEDERDIPFAYYRW
ncbi:hypothetical protein HD806DRAFT_528557 [Xylariaceae sp. AK1471]|nr:hypothetical protein HD806DRAFT_528557 [Xylariaceae sp. AK1471]